ncbi:MAG TPA: PAS domain S-box protein [archaeon]|nr:PAS domain S-box protein [archaeon]
MKSKEKNDNKKVEILIVEDSPTQAIKLQYHLDKKGFMVSIARNGREALAFLKEHRPTLIISDIVMPEMDGFELCRKIKTDEKLKDIPVILLTALSEPDDIIKGLSSGAENFVTKPYDMKFLLSRINYVIVNREMRKKSTAEMGIEVFFAGQRHFITSDRLQILDLLISTYDITVQKSRELEQANKELKKAQGQLKALNEQLEKKVIERTQRISYLNRMILAVRNVNQLITKEKDRDILLQGICDRLIENRSDCNVWIVLLDEAGGFVRAAQAGLGKDFQPLLERLKRNDLPGCCRKALEQPDVVVTEDPSSECTGCPLTGVYSDKGGLCIRLENQGKIYGLLCCSVHREFIKDPEEKNLIVEVAGDITFALFSLEVEEKRKQAEEALQRERDLLDRIMETSPAGIIMVDCHGQITFANPRAEEVLGLSGKDITCRTYNDPKWRITDYEGNPFPDDKLPFRLVMKTGLPVYDIRHAIEWPDGRRVLLSINATPMFDSSGALSGMVATVEDITSRVLMEEQLKESEKKYRELYDNAPVGYHELDTKGNIVRVNQTDAELLGYSKEEMIGRPIKEFIALEDREKSVKGLKLKIKSRKKIEPFERKMVCKDGRVIECLIAENLIIDDQGRVTGLRTTVRDITERKRAEEKLKISEDKYKTLVENIPQKIFLKDSASVYVSCNQNYALDLKIKAEEIAGKTDFDFHPKELAEKYRADDKRVIETNKTEEIEEKYIQNGIEFWVQTIKVPVKDEKGKPVGIMGIFWDITARKKAEEARVLLETAIGQSAEMIVITDSAGTIEYVNPAFEKITGYTQAEALGQTPRLLKSGQQDAAFYQELWETIKNGQVWKGHFVNRKKDGTLYHEKATISPVFDAQGKIVNYAAAKRDITQELDMENQLRHAQKMESLGLLAGGVAHDFNNILTTIMGYSSMIKRVEEIPEKYRKRIEEVEKASQRGAEITRQLLTFSRKQPPKFETVNLNDIVSQSLRFLKRTLGANIMIESSLSESLGLVKADNTQIQQILMNLALNSRDAMPEGGKIRIETSNIEIDKKYLNSHLYAKPGPHVLLSFTDTGAGMDKATISRIFEPFFTTKPVGQGTGLGLSIIYGIVKNHYGFINVYSEVGKGTIFKVYFPRTEEKEKAKAGAEPAVKGGKETVLVVDDEEMIVNLVSGILEDYGYKCLTARDGLEGLNIYREKGENIDLVLLDIVMPRMSGPELFREIIRINPRARIVMSSGFSVQNEKDLLAAGVKAFVPKPYQEKVLARTIREVLDKEK